MIVPKRIIGRGLPNTILNKLPSELHIPGHQYCGPGTRLAERLAREDQGINPLDAVCGKHDIAYSKNRENVQARNVADRVLSKKAWQRVRGSNFSIAEKTAALAIANTMKLKSKFGMVSDEKDKKKRKKEKKTKRGIGKKKSGKVSLSEIVEDAAIAVFGNNKARKVIRSALSSVRDAIKRAGGKSRAEIPRILKVPMRIGGALPFLISLFAGLSATGALASGAAGIMKAVSQAKAAEKKTQGES